MALRVLLYCDDPGYGGTAVNAGLLATGFARHGFVVAVAATANPVDGPSDIPFYRIDYDTQAFQEKSRNSRNEPEAILLAFRPDVVLFCDSTPDGSLAAKRVCADWGLAYVVLVNYVAAGQIAAMEAARQEVARTLDAALALVAVSEDNLALLGQEFGVSRQNARVIHNGRPAQWFETADMARRQALRGALGLSPDDVLVVTVARYEARKGYRHLLEAITSLKARALVSGLYFVWIGQDVDGGAQALRTAVARSGLEDRILVTGERHDVRDWLAAADMFVLPSESEGMPLSLIEAMGQGVPVLATRVGGIPELLGDAGVLLPDPSEDAEAMTMALAGALQHLAASPWRRQDLGNAGRRRALQQFQADSMIAAYVDLLYGLGLRQDRPSQSMPPVADYRPPHLVAEGRKMAWGVPGESIEFLKEGWSHAEGTGRWTQGTRARCCFALPQALARGFVLTLEACPFLGNADGRLETALWVNGREKACLVWKDSNAVRRVELAITLDDAPCLQVAFEFRLQGVSSPASHGMSDDGRLLGLHIAWVRLERLQEATHAVRTGKPTTGQAGG